MTEKEIAEIRRRFRPDKSNISHVCGCYVNEAKEIIGSTAVEIGDRHVLKCGFMLFGLSGFIRYISK